MDEVSRHAFETAKITQSFAAGWYHKHVAGADRLIVNLPVFEENRLWRPLRAERPRIGDRA